MHGRACLQLKFVVGSGSTGIFPKSRAFRRSRSFASHPNRARVAHPARAEDGLGVRGANGEAFGVDLKHSGAWSEAVKGVCSVHRQWSPLIQWALYPAISHELTLPKSAADGSFEGIQIARFDFSRPWDAPCTLRSLERSMRRAYSISSSGKRIPF